MARYHRVFLLEGSTYTVGSPVVITAGALLLDTQKNTLLAQLKLMSIVGQTIKGVKVAVSPLDYVNRPLGPPVQHAYLDLSLKRDEFFGDQEAIFMLNPATRAFSAVVTEVAFADNKVWTPAEDAVCCTLPKQQELLPTLGYDSELMKQYQLRYGGNAEFRYYPDEVAGLRRCACGAINWYSAQNCYACYAPLQEMLTCDMTQLAGEKNARLAAEQAEREAKAAAEQAERAKREAAARERVEAVKAKASETAKKIKKILMIAVPAALAIAAAVLIVTKVVIPNSSYNKAVALMNAGKYDEAITAFQAMDGFRDSKAKIVETEKLKAQATLEAGIAAAENLEKQCRLAEAAMAYGALADQSPECREHSFALWDQIASRPTLAAGTSHTVAVRTDGTVVAAGKAKAEQCMVSGWSDVIAVAAGNWHTVGLKSDGTVLAAGEAHSLQCDVADWTDIVAVAAGTAHTVGLKADGTVVAVGNNEFGQCDVSEWTDIVAVAAGSSHTVGLRADGTVVAVGAEAIGQCDVSDWTDIVAVAAGGRHTVGLKADGTVVAVGAEADGQCDVSDWTDIVSVSAGDFHTVGLKSDGTIVAVGDNGYGQCDVSEWTDIRLPAKRGS